MNTRPASKITLQETMDQIDSSGKPVVMIIKEMSDRTKIIVDYKFEDSTGPKHQPEYFNN